MICNPPSKNVRPLTLGICNPHSPIFDPRILPLGVPADLQSAVKKCSTSFPWGFAIPTYLK